MKTIRIEIHVTAIVHIGENLSEAPPPVAVACRAETVSIVRTVPLSDSFLSSNESGNAYATTKAHAVSALAGLASVLPEKLAHQARSLV